MSVPNIRLLVVAAAPELRAALAPAPPPYEVATASSVDAALHLLDRGERFDAILCEAMMPEKNGIDFYAELSVKHPDLGTTVIFLLDPDFPPLPRRFLQSVGCPCVEKPVEWAELRAILERERST
jgi:DNA-binding response OmpR family regulator